MKTKLPRVLEPLLPFVGVGIAIAFGIGLFIMLAYILMWGLFIGGLIWAVVMIKKYVFPRAKSILEGEQSDHMEGRIIEHQNKS